MKYSTLRNISGMIIVTACRFLLAITFLFSGFVKAVDPMGMLHKVVAYFAHWNLNVTDDSLLLRVCVILLAIIEFSLGVSMLLGIRKKLVTAGIMIFMLAMTMLTIYIYIYDPVPDCGCFGDAIILSNGQTLAKNIVLLLCSLITFFQRGKLFRLVSERNQWTISLYSKIYIILLGIQSFHYLPAIDFTPYQCGLNLRNAYYAPTDNTPEELLTLAFFDNKGEEDLTDSIIRNPGNVFLLTLPQVRTADDGCNDRINDLYDECRDLGYSFYGVVSPDVDKKAFEDWIDRTGAAYPFLKCDDVQLKAMVRSNPGLLLLRDGILLKKWSNNNLPDMEEFRSITSPQEAREAIAAASNLRQLLRLCLWFAIPLAIIIIGDRVWIGQKFYRHHIFKKRLNKQQT